MSDNANNFSYAMCPQCGERLGGLTGHVCQPITGTQGTAQLRQYAVYCPTCGKVNPPEPHVCDATKATPETPAERRRYALLQAAMKMRCSDPVAALRRAEIADGETFQDVDKSSVKLCVDVAMAILAEIERREP